MKRIVLFAMVMGMMIMGSSCVSSSGNLYRPSYEGDSQFTSSSSSFDHNYQRRHKKYCEERGDLMTTMIPTSVRIIGLTILR